MITILIPSTFIPERSYAIRTLLTHYMGIPVEIVPDVEARDYNMTWDDKSIIIRDDFFGKIPDHTSYADASFLPGNIIQAKAMGLEEILILYGTEHLEVARNKVICGVDLFAGAFFMLTRWEESVGAHTDLHHRFPAANAALVKDGFILRPVVDEYVSLIRQWLSGLGFILPKTNTRFSVIPTCDVDIPFYWRSKPLWKILGGRLKQHWNPIKSVEDYKNYKSISQGKGKDPYDCFDYMMSLAEDKGCRFQFNFISGGNTRFEGYYRIDDPHITALIHLMKERGHSIGLHPSYDSYRDEAMIQKEKERLESVAGISVTHSRQHYLRFALPETWSHLNTAGIQEDSTLGYAAEPGFRCGTCKPFPVFDIHRRETLELIERPLLIMDVSLRMYKNLSIADSILLCREIKDQVQKHDGELVILWHNSSLSEIDGWEGWQEVLESMFN